jgi:hypothetical protein
MHHFHPQAEDILTDEDLLELFRVIKQIIKKKPDAERIAKLYFCIVYAMGDLYQFYKPIHSDFMVFRDESNINTGPITADVQLPSSVSCCQNKAPSNSNNNWKDPNASTATPNTILSPQALSSPSSSSSSAAIPQRLLSVSYLTNPMTPPIKPCTQLPQIMARLPPPAQKENEVTTDQYSVRPYTNMKPIYPSTSTSAYPVQPPWSPIDEQQQQQQQAQAMSRYPHLNTLIHGGGSAEVLMEPKQRGFYYQDGRITKEPALLQRYAEQGVLTQASLMRKRKKTVGGEGDFSSYELSTLPAPAKKPKIPHRHGEFKQRRKQRVFCSHITHKLKKKLYSIGDDIISRMRTIMMADLEQKAQRLPNHFTLGIEKTNLPANLEVDDPSTEDAGKLLAPALRILTLHSNMKPHLDNGMNQNGIYYNSDYFRLYLAFVQFQSVFGSLFPNEVIKITNTVSTPPIEDGTNIPSPSSMAERDKDRERNANMKAYRGWIEPFLTETNWAAFRRNIMVGERIMQLTKVVGQGVLLMTKELSGSKLHLTFTNNEWDEFIQGLSQGLWDETIDWSHDEVDQSHNGGSLLVNELRLKFATHFWFTEQGTVVPPAERKAARARERQLNQSNKKQ